MIEFKKAKRTHRHFKGALIGVSGSGKTWSALEIAKGLVGEGKICVLDTEQSSASLYAERFDFDSCDITDTSVKSYLEGIKAAVSAGYQCLIIDSLSHAWEYLLAEVDNIAAKSTKQNSYTAWRDVTPIYNQLVKAIVAAPIHIIATMRAKSDYVMEEYTDSQGRKKTAPKKVGLAPIFRQGGEYEFDFIGTIDLDHRLVVEKSRIDFLADKVILKPDSAVGEDLRRWLDAAPPAPPVRKEIPISESVASLVNAGKFSEIGLLSLKTKCAHQGKQLLQIVTDHPGWVQDVLKTKRDKLHADDLTALEALATYVGETSHAN